MTSPIPAIHLLCLLDKFAHAFESAHETTGLASYDLPIKLHSGPLSQFDPSIAFDLIVSPANSYGLLDGAFDDAISRAFTPKTDYYRLTRVVQAELFSQYRGFAPPGSCIVVGIPPSFDALSRSGNPWNCRYVGICPTMRTPDDASWDREIVYECVWSLLCAIDRHNRLVKAGRAGPEDVEIRSILMTPLATGVGRVSPEKWAMQASLAIKHYISAVEDPAVWSCLDWSKAEELSNEVAATHGI